MPKVFGPSQPLNTYSGVIGDVSAYISVPPILHQDTTGNAANVTGIVGVEHGGTGVTTKTGTGNVVLSDSPVLVAPAIGTPVSGDLQNCSFPTLNQNTTGTAANVTGTVQLDHGGTGATTAAAARTNLSLNFYSFGGCFIGTPAVSSTIFLFVSDNSFTLPTNLSGSYFKCGGNPSSTTVLNIYLNNSLIGTGTISFSTGGVATITTTQQSIVPGDVIKITTPANVYGISNLVWTIKGTY
ncbi:MAG: hypothetical protein WC511_02990 [Candidatus Pacearchaeota archaeon]